jgi:hypothetical protein
MTVMAPRIAVLLLDTDNTTPLLPGTWTLAARGNVGSFPSREYRNAAGNVVVVVKLAQGTKSDGTPIALVVVWVDMAARTWGNGALATWIQNNTVAQWPSTVNADGSITCDALEADAGAIATRAKLVWPSTWRVRLPGDSPGDPMHGIPASPPTGPRCIAEWIA